MADTRQQHGRREPAGFTPRTSGLASEHAREQGWDINEEQRSQTPREKQKYDGGRDYDYGAQGVTAIDTDQTHRDKGPARKASPR